MDRGAIHGADRGGHDLAKVAAALDLRKVAATARLDAGVQQFALDLAGKAVGRGGQYLGIFGRVSVAAQHAVEFADQAGHLRARHHAQPVARKRKARVVHLRAQRLVELGGGRGRAFDQLGFQLVAIEQARERRLQRAGETRAETRKIARDGDRVERVRQQLCAMLRGATFACGDGAFDHWTMSDRK